MNIAEIQLLTGERVIVNKDGSLPTVKDDSGGLLTVGRECYQETGGLYYWTGTEWKPVNAIQKLCQIAEFLREIRDNLYTEAED